jgi:hypothetical protein
MSIYVCVQVVAAECRAVRVPRLTGCLWSGPTKGDRIAIRGREAIGRSSASSQCCV